MKHVDLLINDNALALNSAGDPLLVGDRESIAQDIAHLIRESGLLIALIGQRDRSQRTAQLLKIQLLCENDRRIIPGTVQITEQHIVQNRGHWLLVADSVEYGPIRLDLAAQAGAK